MEHRLILRPFNGTFAVVHLSLARKTPPQCPGSGELWSLTRSHLEYSLVCTSGHAQSYQDPTERIDDEWAAFYLKGPIPFGMTGIIARLTGPLGEAGVGCFVVSTFDSDVVMVKTKDIATASQAWAAAGIRLHDQALEGENA